MTSDLIKAEDERLRRERAFHNDRFEEEENRDAQLKYYDAIKDCLKAYHERVIELAAGADIIEYGCSLGRIGRGQNLSLGLIFLMLRLTTAWPRRKQQGRTMSILRS